jgi:hypothetical protein
LGVIVITLLAPVETNEYHTSGISCPAGQQGCEVNVVPIALVVVPIKHAFPVASNVIGVAFIQSSLET